MSESLFAKYGGVDTIRRIVGDFYSDVLESPNLRPFFKSVNMERLMEHQTNLLCHLLGGPVDYDGRQMADAHKHLKITEADFAEVAKILQENLEDAGVEDDDVATILGVVAGYAGQIITA